MHKEQIPNESLPVRLYGLDVWRAILLCIGPFVHSASLVSLSGGQIYSGVQFASNIFRMEVFFALSVIVSLLAFQRKNRWISRRIIQLILPAMVVFLTLMPMWWFSTGEDYFDIDRPEHLWFLLSLSLASLIGWLAMKADLIEKMVFQVERWNPFFLIAIMVITGAFGRLVYRGGMWALNFEADLLTQTILQTVYYGQFYLLGWTIGMSGKLKEKIIAMRIVPIAILVYLAYLIAFNINPYMWGVDPARPPAMKIIAAVSPAIPAVLISFAIIHSAMRYTGKLPKILDLLRQASFSIYLFHMPLVGIAWMLLRDQDPALTFLGCVLFSFFISLAMHYILVDRSPTLAFLYNGRWPSVAAGRN